MAQLVAQAICNRQVVGSIPTAGSGEVRRRYAGDRSRIVCPLRRQRDIRVTRYGRWPAIARCRLPAGATRVVRRIAGSLGYYVAIVSGNSKRRRSKKWKAGRRKPEGRAHDGRRQRLGRQMPSAPSSAPGAHGSASEARWSKDDEQRIDRWIASAAHARCEGQGDRRDDLIDRLAVGSGTAGGAELVQERLAAVLVGSIAVSFHNGWEPLDVVSYVRRKAGATATKVTAAYLAAPACHRTSADDRIEWERQVAAVSDGARALSHSSPSWRADLAAAISALGILQHVSRIEDLRSVGRAGRKARSQDEERMLARVRALLAKAESSEFPEEADALMSKAQQLMTDHCLDRALVEDGKGQDGDGCIDARRCWLDDPYIEAKGILLHVVGKANRCRVVLSCDIGFATIVGHPDDIDASELLFTSLLMQVTRRMADPGAPVHAYRSRRPAYRRSFILAYATRIGARLAEASSSATASANQAHGGDLLPVLVRRDADVDQAVEKIFGDLQGRSISATDQAGWIAGTAAADLADLVVREELGR